MRLRSFAHTDIGRVRAENEDRFLCDDSLRLYAVADGIGGLPGGAQASELAVATLGEIFRRATDGDAPDYAICLREINERVFKLGQVISERIGIGTTLVFGHVIGQTLNVVHVGDSFLYRFRGGDFEQMTVEHNIENEARQRIERGEPVGLIFENRQALTRCVGQPPPLEGDFLSIEMKPGDRYLFCSDGITRMQTPKEITNMLAQTKDPKKWVTGLIDRANDRGGFDNSTAVALFVE